MGGGFENRISSQVNLLDCNYPDCETPAYPERRESGLPSLIDVEKMQSNRGKIRSQFTLGTMTGSNNQLNSSGNSSPCNHFQSVMRIKRGMTLTNLAGHDDGSSVENFESDIYGGDEELIKLEELEVDHKQTENEM